MQSVYPNSGESSITHTDNDIQDSPVRNVENALITDLQLGNNGSNKVIVENVADTFAQVENVHSDVNATRPVNITVPEGSNINSQAQNFNYDKMMESLSRVSEQHSDK